MSFELTSLKFNVDTGALLEAIVQVDKLGTSVAKLTAPLKTLETTTTAVAKATKDNASATTAQVAATDAQTAATEKQSAATKKSYTLIEKHTEKLRFMAEGYSSGQASILATAKLTGSAADEVKRLSALLDSQRKLIGGDPFDKSSSGLKALTQQLGAAREGYRQMLIYQKEYKELSDQGNGGELRLVALNRKETDALYRDKQRLIEQYKVLKAAQIDPSNLEMISKQKNAYKTLVTEVQQLEATYKKVATAKRPLDDIRTVDATKRNNELRYLARATSVQLGDIGISLAGGQNPLTVFLQQGDQLRGIFNQVGASASEMKTALSTAFSQIVVGIKDVAFTLVKFVGYAFVDAGKYVVDFIAKSSGITALFDGMTKALNSQLGVGNAYVNVLNKIRTAATALMTAGVLALAATLVGLAVAYKELYTVSSDLSVALATNGAAMGLTQAQALAMAKGMSSINGSSMDAARGITELTKAGGISNTELAKIMPTMLESNKYLGTSLEDLAKGYAKLKDDPVKALTEIGLATGRVTASEIEHVRMLVEQGKLTEANALALDLKLRAEGAGNQIIKEEMGGISALWIEIKGQVKEAGEYFQVLLDKTSSVASLTDVWQTFASSVVATVYEFKVLAVLIEGVSLGMNALKLGQFELAGQVYEKTKGELTNAKNEYDSAMQRIKVGTAKTGATDDPVKRQQNREGIKVWNDLTEAEKKYVKASTLTREEQKKKIEQEKALVDSYLANPNLDLTEAQKQAKRKKLYAGIEDAYKPKKDAGATRAMKDELDAQIQAVKEADEIKQRDYKNAADERAHQLKLNTISEVDAINQIADIQRLAIVQHIIALQQEQAILSKKSNSLKEVAAVEKQIAKARDEIHQKTIDQGRQLELVAHKRTEEINKGSDAIFAEVSAMAKANDAERERIELIGLSSGKVAEVLDKRKADTILLQENRVEMLRGHATTQEGIRLLDAEIAKLNELKTARQLATDASFAESKQRVLGTQPTTGKYTAGVVGTASSKVASTANDEQKIIDIKRKAYEEEIQNKKNLTQADKERFATILADITAMESRLTLNVKIAGLEDITNQFDALAGGFSSAAQANLNRVTAQVNNMGSAYKEQGKAMLKNAQDQVNATNRLQNGMKGTVTAIKNLKENEAKYKEGSKERSDAQIEGYAQMAGAAKGFFEEGTAGYELLTAVEQGFRAFQLASSIAAMMQGKAETAEAVTQSGTKAVASAAAGGAKMFEQSGWGGFVGVVAMLAVLASLGFSGGGSGGGGGAGGGTMQGMYAETGQTMTASGRVGNKAPLQYQSNESANDNPEYAVWLETEAAADKAYTALRATNSGLTEFEQRLEDVKKGVQGVGRAAYESATAGMTQAERATYDYNVSLRIQAEVLVDLANGADATSDTMRKLASESEQLSIDLMEASGDIAGARRAQMLVDTRGYSADEVAIYNHNQALRDQIAAANAGASAAADAAQAERDLAQARYEIAGRLNILLGRTTQLEFDRATELAGTTDATSIQMLKLIYQLEDLNTAIDNSLAVLERSITKEKELATVRLNSAKEIQALLKSAVDSSTLELTRANAQAQLSSLLARTKQSGILPTADTLRPVLASLAKPSQELFATFEDYQRDFLRTANDIADMSDIANKQVSFEQRTIETLDQTLQTAKEQLDALRGVDNSVQDVATAVANFGVAMQALADAQAVAPVFNFTAPAPSYGGGGGGGYYGGGGDSAGGSAQIFENLAYQTNSDIVGAYRAYFNRNPDEASYYLNLNSGMSGDTLMKSILGGAGGANTGGNDYNTAIANGFDPNNPNARFYKSKLGSSSGGGGSNNPYYDGGLAVGINEVPYDMDTTVHKGERILPAADNRELFARLSSPDETNRVLIKEVKALRDEVIYLRSATVATAKHSSKTADILERLTPDGNSLSVSTVET